MNSLTLYELTGEYKEALTVLSELDLDKQAVCDTLEGLQGAIEVKAQNVAMFVKNLEATAEAIKEAESKMAARRKAIEARAEFMKNYILNNMKVCNMTRIDSPYFSLSIRKNPASVVIDNAGLIPEEYKRIPEPPAPLPDKKAIAAAIKEGFEIPGVHIEQTERLHIG